MLSLRRRQINEIMLAESPFNMELQEVNAHHLRLGRLAAPRHPHQAKTLRAVESR